MRHFLKKFYYLQYMLIVLFLLYVKKNFSSRFSESIIAKRTRSIEKFMKGILIHPLMRHDEIFYNFISIVNEADYEKKKKASL